MMYTKLKNDILGKGYSLSIAFVSKKKSRELNKKYRKKDKPTNVLSFALSKNLGELVLCKAVIKTEAKKQGQIIDEWTGFLVIHGMLHLKGLDHSKKLEKLENTYLSRTKF